MQIAIFATVGPLLVGYRGRRAGRLLWRLADIAVRPAGRRRRHLPVPGAGDRHRRRCSGPGLRQHVHRRQRASAGCSMPGCCAARSACRSSATMPRPRKVMGYTDARIILRHLLPNAITPDHRLLDDRHGAGHPARLQPGLSRPGRPAADGRMGRADRRRQELHDHGLVDLGFPGIAIVLAGVGFSLLGDGIADLLRPRR